MTAWPVLRGLPPPHHPYGPQIGPCDDRRCAYCAALDGWREDQARFAIRAQGEAISSRATRREIIA